jgi:hypothetical protein
MVNIFNPHAPGGWLSALQGVNEPAWSTLWVIGLMTAIGLGKGSLECCGRCLNTP